MRLRRACEHDCYDPHTVTSHVVEDVRIGKGCPGGEFLPEGALVIEKVDGERTCEMPLWNLGYEAREVEPQPCGMPAKFLFDGKTFCIQCVGDALASQVGESE